MAPIEQAITKGCVAYFNAIEHDAERRERTLRCLPNPPGPTVTRSVIFHALADLHTEWLNGAAPDPAVIKTLIGADSYSSEDAGLVRYGIQTDLRCLIFASWQPPEVVKYT
ncbi:hypothetical protein F8S13_20610 [Chloroflexia bacterium SDU3-3]|nr:hypothetical protein F8S13_20610 [Chloroflexia bacterium SDU3-3]